MTKLAYDESFKAFINRFIDSINLRIRISREQDKIKALQSLKAKVSKYSAENATSAESLKPFDTMLAEFRQSNPVLEQDASSKAMLDKYAAQCKGYIFDTNITFNSAEIASSFAALEAIAQKYRNQAQDPSVPKEFPCATVTFDGRAVSGLNNYALKYLNWQKPVDLNKFIASSVSTDNRDLSDLIFNPNPTSITPK